MTTELEERPAVKQKISELPYDELARLKIAISDKKAAIKRAFESEYNALKEKEDKIKAVFLARFNESGMESVRTKFGTAFKSKQTSATVGDKEVFREFCISHDAMQLMEIRCSKTDVVQYMEAHNELPPGINYREEVVVNIRRS